ncbi:MAG: hypothetical protein JSS07_11735 [Proteobacteria bacterium]|nr:hypothetical protein [Pseudomonadota bacterium]
MLSFERSMILCKIKLSNERESTLCFVPELVNIQVCANAFSENKINASLQEKIRNLKLFEQRYGLGVVPLKGAQTKKFIEDLYNDILNNRLPLPANTSQRELKFRIKDFNNDSKNFVIHDFKLKFLRSKLTFYAKYLPIIGNIVTLTLTLGLTYTTFVTILGWGWSIPLLSVFGISRFLMNYADIAGGPERRLQTLGLWIDRQVSKIYLNFGKFSPATLFLNLLVIGILSCSTLLTWYGAWQMIRCIAGMTHLPNFISTSIASLFAWSSAGSTFGRVYADLYQLLYNVLSPYLSFDNVKENEKLNLNTLFEKLQSHRQADEPNINFQSASLIQSSLILNQFKQQTAALEVKPDLMASEIKPVTMNKASL